MAENVVKLPAEKPASKRRIDLRGNNRFRDLLDTYVEQAAIIASAMKLKKEADDEIREVLGDAEYARADGYEVTVTRYPIKERVMKATEGRRMVIRPRAGR